MNKARFITFEGGEGCGKSVQTQLLAEYLRQKGIDVLTTKEPGGTPIGQKLRSILVEGDKEKLDCVAEMLLYYADRRIHLQSKILPAMAEGKWVISDRYADSTMAYQYYGYECRLEKSLLDKMYRIAAGDFVPDLTIILDLPPEVGLSRSFKKAQECEVKELRFENMDIKFHQNLRNGFLQIAKENPNRCVVIDASGSVEEVHQKIVTAVEQRLGI